MTDRCAANGGTRLRSGGPLRERRHVANRSPPGCWMQESVPFDGLTSPLMERRNPPNGRRDFRRYVIPKASTAASSPVRRETSTSGATIPRIDCDRLPMNGQRVRCSTPHGFPGPFAGIRIGIPPGVSLRSREPTGRSDANEGFCPGQKSEGPLDAKPRLPQRSGGQLRLQHGEPSRLMSGPLHPANGVNPRRNGGPLSWGLTKVMAVR